MFGSRIVRRVSTMADSGTHPCDKDKETAPAAPRARLGLIVASTAVFGVAGLLAVLWSGGSFLAAFGGYMLGGWLGLAFAVLTILWRDSHA